jgi:hypothetical protein
MRSIFAAAEVLTFIRSTIPETPTGPARWFEAARVLSLQMRTALEQSLPGHVVITADERVRLSAAANVPDDFLEQIAQALEGAASWAADSKLRPADLREVIAMSQAFSALANDIESSVLRGIRDTITARRAEVGEEALRLYGVWRKVVRPRDRESAVPHLVRLKEALNRGRLATRRRATRKPAAQPAPAPPAGAEGGAA